MTVRAMALLATIALAAPAKAQTLGPPAGEAPTIATTIGPLTPQDLTKPNQLIECEVRSIDGRNHSFALRYHGERGYVDPETGQAEATSGRIDVVRDDSNLFSGYDRWSRFQHWFEARSDRADATFGPAVRLQIERTDFEREAVTRTTWAMLVQAMFQWMPLTKAVGLCRVDSSDQQPLTDVETREHLRGAGRASDK